MKQDQTIPFYAPDGRSLGFRTLEAAERLVAGGHVKGSYGRKKNLRAIWLRQEDGRRVSTTLRHSDTEFREYFRLSFVVC
jgi:hypothetical protein